MHKVTLPDGSRVKDRWLKWLRVTAYALMCTSGVLLIASPVLLDFYEMVAEIMAVFLAVGGFLSFLGALFERWWGEYTGLPLLSTSFMVFALISSKGGWEVAPYITAANFALLWAVALALLARWRDARAIYRLAVHMAEKPPEEVL